MTDQSPKKRSAGAEYVRQAAMQVTAGGSAGWNGHECWTRDRWDILKWEPHVEFSGFVEVCIMQPLDLVKTRLQLQRGGGPAASTYNGVVDCFKKMYVQEGFLSFYKGIAPPIIAETPKRAVKVSSTLDIFQFLGRLTKPFTNLFFPVSVCHFRTVQAVVQLWRPGSNTPGTVTIPSKPLTIYRF